MTIMVTGATKDGERRKRERDREMRREDYKSREVPLTVETMSVSLWAVMGTARKEGECDRCRET
jgi:hypothetical protein